MTVRHILLVLSISGSGAGQADGASDEWWPPEVARALARAKDNRPELVKALAAVPRAQRKGMAFLIANMPEPDLWSVPPSPPSLGMPRDFSGW